MICKFAQITCNFSKTTCKFYTVHVTRAFKTCNSSKMNCKFEQINCNFSNIMCKFSNILKLKHFQLLTLVKPHVNLPKLSLLLPNELVSLAEQINNLA